LFHLADAACVTQEKRASRDSPVADTSIVGLLSCHVDRDARRIVTAAGADRQAETQSQADRAAAATEADTNIGARLADRRQTHFGSAVTKFVADHAQLAARTADRQRGRRHDVPALRVVEHRATGATKL